MDDRRSRVIVKIKKAISALPPEAQVKLLFDWIHVNELNELLNELSKVTPESNHDEENW